MKANKLITTLLALGLGIFSQTASADFIGLKVGGGIWDFETSGTIRYVSLNDVDLKNDLKLQDDQGNYTYVVFEHPVPLIPNVKVSKTGLSTNGAGTVSTDFSYGGTTYTAATNVATELVLDHQDVTIYYELLDNLVTVDVGLTAKMIDGSVTVNSSRNQISGTIPMVYGAVGVSIPGVGIYVGVEGSALKIGDSEISDMTAKVSYSTSFMLGVEAGIRTVTVKLDGLDGVSSSMEFSGPFANVFLHF